MLPPSPRGYAHFYVWEERKVIFADGARLRASGIAEFAVRDAPPRYAWPSGSNRHGADPRLKDAGSTQWMGRRPVNPGLISVIGRGPAPPKRHLAFARP